MNSWVQCPNCRQYGDLLSTSNEWQHYCGRCDLRFRTDGVILWQGRAIPPWLYKVANVDDRIDACLYYRAAGGCLCPVCHREYWRHPMVGPEMWDVQFLHLLCGGDLVKL